jgi:membrane-bound lytic murein transglycosylase D
MKYIRPRFIPILFCCALFLAEFSNGNHAVSFAAPLKAANSNSPLDIMASILKNSFIPNELIEVLQASYTKYMEGCELIQAGESDKARVAFNEAVDLVVSTNLDLTSTLPLNLFFQDLIQRIPEEISLNSSNSEEFSRNKSLIPLTISPSLKDEFLSNLSDTGYGIPIIVNKTVAKSLYYWLNDGRRIFVEGLLRSGKYLPIIEKIFTEESVPLDLMYLAQVESLFKTSAYSKARAKGIWQFNKGTAIRYGLRVTPDVDERSDPEKSTRAAARYLKDLHEMFGDWNLVLAAYNWGEGRVQKLIKRTGVNDFWKLVDSGQRIPKETKNHVPLIHASIILARNPEKYGLPLELDPPLEYVEVSVSRPMDLRAAAQVLNTTIDELKRLNPSLKSVRTPADYPDFRLKIPADSDPDLREHLAELSAKIEPSLERIRRHKILPGEALIKIAAKYQVSVAEIMKVNQLTSKHRIVAGKYINIPYSLENTESETGVMPKSVSSISNQPTMELSAKKGNSSVSKQTGSDIANAPGIGTIVQGSSSEAVP